VNSKEKKEYKEAVKRAKKSVVAAVANRPQPDKAPKKRG
jgi:hypothetical protein